MVGAAGMAPADPSGPLRVIDADTFDVGGERVRLFGVDAPELSQNCVDAAGQDWPCGAWAAEEAARRWEGRLARCEAVDTDRYGRIVARCAVGGSDIGAALVEDGLAMAYRTYSMDYDLQEKAAVIAAVGIWAGEVQTPADWRAAQAPAPQPVPGECVIKGNVSSNGRIYHVPGQADYERTRIDESRGEHWFCSETEAVAAGWRPASR